MSQPTAQQGLPQGSPLNVITRTTDEYFAEDGSDPRFFIHGRVGSRRLTFRIKVRDLNTNEKSSIPTQVFFDAMMNHLEPGDPPFYAVIGDWSDADPDYLSNLYFFNQGINAGQSREEAARNTSTGQLAMSWGYVNVDFVTLNPPGATQQFTRVLARFINPNK